MRHKIRRQGLRWLKQRSAVNGKPFFLMFGVCHCVAEGVDGVGCLQGCAGECVLLKCPMLLGRGICQERLLRCGHAWHDTAFITHVGDRTPIWLVCVCAEANSFVHNRNFHSNNTHFSTCCTLPLFARICWLVPSFQGLSYMECDLLHHLPYKLHTTTIDLLWLP